MRSLPLTWRQGPSAVVAPWFLLAALAATALDLGFAMLFWAGEGVAPLRIPQSIAAWAVGAEAFAGGARTAAMGVLVYLALIWGLARLHAMAARRLPVLRRNPVRGGLLYGASMYVVVFHLAVPLFAVDGAAPARLDWIMACVLAYMLLIGLPCAWATHRMLRH
ncbi:hypothetical protein [Pseudoxanthomonas putridarboris]|uniref:DUF2569 domain-containing protein n=1 Tax=Pseudoxanthomonas putridarboris TaxID=752605 RepID=A0ABU9J429_9GAMM